MVNQKNPVKGLLKPTTPSLMPVQENLCLSGSIHCGNLKIQGGPPWMPVKQYLESEAERWTQSVVYEVLN